MNSLTIGVGLFVYSVSSLVAVLILASCSGASRGGLSQIKVQIPKASDLHQATANHGSSQNRLDWDLGCYALNVTASDIPNAATSSCQIPTGVLAGTVASGGTLTINVPRGTARKLDVLLYKRTNAATPCPTLNGTFGTLDPGSFVRVGTVASFDAVADTVTLDVNLVLPGPTDTLVTQYLLAKTCTALGQTPMGSSGLDLAHANLSGGNYKVDVTIHAPSTGITLKGGSYIINLGH